MTLDGPPMRAHANRRSTSAHSFIVQAPAGSGKTTVLTQRYLQAADDRRRARAGARDHLHAQGGRRNARARAEGARRRHRGPLARRRADARARGRGARTCRARAAGASTTARRACASRPSTRSTAYLANSLPITSQNGFGRGIADAPDDLYAIAARETLRYAESDPELRKDFELILRRLDDSWQRLEQLIAECCRSAPNGCPTCRSFPAKRWCRRSKRACAPS